MLTVRVMEDRVVIKLNRKSGRRAFEGSLPIRPDVPEPPIIEPALADAITHWACGSEEPQSSAARAAVQRPFHEDKREVVLYEDRITVCGEELWRDCGQAHLRDALALLSRTDKNGYVRIRGTQLSKDLGRDATNHIGKPLADFCKRVSDCMRARGLECGREDVIKNSAGGYHLRDWIIIRIVGSWAEPLGISHSKSEILSGSMPSEKVQLNPRQRWILEQLTAGVKLTLKDVVAHFRAQWNRSTINRDLRVLRERGLITKHTAGHYVPSDHSVALRQP
jgi:hypothetical protein